jgi:hypothetical protein
MILKKKIHKTKISVTGKLNKITEMGNYQKYNTNWAELLEKHIGHNLN